MGVLEVMFPDGSLGVVYDLFGIIYGPVVVSPMLCCFVNIYQIVFSYVDRGAIPPFFFLYFSPSLYTYILALSEFLYQTLRASGSVLGTSFRPTYSTLSKHYWLDGSSLDECHY